MVPDRGPGTGTNNEKCKWNTTFCSEIPTGKTVQWDEPTKRVPFTAEPKIPEILTKCKAPTISSSQTISCGIPQGSTLGPLLFLLYINDLPNCSSKLSFRIFADDANMFYTSNNLHNLEFVMNDELKSEVKYCAINKLSTNFLKTNFILVSSSCGSINVDNIKIKSQIKYLGVYIDQHLHCRPQITHINNKLAKNIATITKLRHFVNLNTMKQLYYSFTYPYLTYAITSWGSA